MDRYVIMALVATLGTWLVTALGAATVIFFKSPHPKGLNIMLGFASGVMIAASFWSLLQPAIERAEAYSALPLEELLRTSDVVSIHCPLNERTRSLIGAEQLAEMKPSAILINVARGGIVDEAALADALNEKRLRGAALDVFTSEPLRESPLYTLRDPYRLLASPHNAWSPVEAIDRLIGCIEQNIEDFVTRQ